MKQKILFSGFTLLEMMVTVAIIGILAAIAFPSYQRHVEKTNLTHARADMVKAIGFIKVEMVRSPNYIEQNHAGLENKVKGMIDAGLKDKYNFAIKFIERSPQDKYRIGFSIYAEPKGAGYTYAAWADTNGSDYACTEGTRSANIEAAKKFQTTMPCSTK